MSSLLSRHNSYVCRDCGGLKTPSLHELHFTRRVICHRCGGTCDPTPLTSKRYAKMRQRDREVRESRSRDL